MVLDFIFSLICIFVYILFAFVLMITIQLISYKIFNFNLYKWLNKILTIEQIAK